MNKLTFLTLTGLVLAPAAALCRACEFPMNGKLEDLNCHRMELIET